MSDYDDTNRGSIWRNEKKATDKHPDFTGSANVDGIEYWVSAWKRDPGGNPKAPALRFSFTAKERTETPPAPSLEQKAEALLNDDIPF